ncbi:glycosyltransferase family 2 protein [Donghicola mangrovi]|uniref:Glycosyltransferase n=1 Tax=Donghicola mangrovi TaxID=2729614 RepID=A0A850Q6S8_9RHOB|nr:glycosyltransferase [Donghicola mangrovi]NVO25477.1 glycosyltransferase [Donghicola mangrovi]
MDTAHILSLFKKGQYLRALICFHQVHKDTKQLSARDLMLRARILSKLGKTAEALEDIDSARLLEGADPDIQVIACALGQEKRPEQTHDIAVQILLSEVSLPSHRKAAIRFLLPERLPLILQTPLKVVDRITLVFPAGEQAKITPREEGDFPEVLGAHRSGDQYIVAQDHYVAKGTDAERIVQIEVGAREKSITVLPFVELDPALIGAGSKKRSRLWIIMPVHDGGKVLERCLDSVLKELKRTAKVRLVIVNDASRERSTEKLLRAVSENRRVTVVHSPRSLGFVGAVNLGLRSIGTGPVLLLNSDTYLPKHTLSRMLEHLNEPDVGTVTPLSNNAGSFSVPEPLTAYKMPSPATVEELAKLAYKQNAGISVDVLNGNGFAMMISEKCLHDTGFLSEDFGAGYYEEVDFCIRASAKGYRHLAAVDCFIGHVGGVTFGEEKKNLISKNGLILSRKYPFHHQAYARYALIDPLKIYRSHLMASTSWRPRKHSGDDALKPQIIREIDLIDKVVIPVLGEVDDVFYSKPFSEIIVLPEDVAEVGAQKLRSPKVIHLQYLREFSQLTLWGTEVEPIAYLDLKNSSQKSVNDFEEIALRLLGVRQDAA